MTDTKDLALDPDANYYGLQEDTGYVTPCRYSLEEARARLLPLSGQFRVVAWLGQLPHIEVPDDWPPKTKASIAEVLDAVWLAKNITLPREKAALYQRIKEHGVECGHRSLNRDEVEEVVRRGWSHAMATGSNLQRAIADAVVAAFSDQRPEWTDDDIERLAQKARVAAYHLVVPWDRAAENHRKSWRDAVRAVLADIEGNQQWRTPR